MPSLFACNTCCRNTCNNCEPGAVPPISTTRRMKSAAEAACVRIGKWQVRLGAAELDLRNSGLKALPESIGELRALTRLNVGHNQLKELPATIGSLTALTRLSVHDNQLKKLPATIGSLTALTKLSVGENQLTELPAAIGSLTALTELSVYNNQLTELPAAIGSLTALTVLWVGGNQLTELPAAIGSLAALTWLQLRNRLGARGVPSVLGAPRALVLWPVYGSTAPCAPSAPLRERLTAPAPLR